MGGDVGEGRRRARRPLPWERVSPEATGEGSASAARTPHPRCAATFSPGRRRRAVRACTSPPTAAGAARSASRGVSATNDRLHHARAFATRIMEKYGASLVGERQRAARHARPAAWHARHRMARRRGRAGRAAPAAAPRCRPTFRIAAASASARRRSSSASESVAGSTASTSSRRTSGRPLAAAQAVSEVTPGTIVRGKALRQPVVQIDERAVEERVALAEHRHVAAGGKMRGDLLRGAVVDLGRLGPGAHRHADGDLDRGRPE